jgi:hypothetical protein
MAQYFHEIESLQWSAMKALGMTWGEVKAHYLAPEWCEAGQSAVDPMGCWSLIDRLIRCRADCDGCEYAKEIANPR